jgi:hypothetical protein
LILEDGVKGKLTFTAKEVPAGAFPIQLKVGAAGQETMMVIQQQDAQR